MYGNVPVIFAPAIFCRKFPSPKNVVFPATPITAASTVIELNVFAVIELASTRPAESVFVNNRSYRFVDKVVDRYPTVPRPTTVEVSCVAR